MRFDKEILALAVDPHQPVWRAHNAFYAINRRKSGPLKGAYGVENRIGIENPSAGLISLAAIQITTPALVLWQAKRRQSLFNGMVMSMLRAGREFRQILARQVEQGAIDFSLGGLHAGTIAAEMLPPRLKRGLAFRRCAIFFISDNNVRRGELIAEVLIGHRFFIKQQTRVEQAQGGAQIDPRLVDR